MLAPLDHTPFIFFEGVATPTFAKAKAKKRSSPYLLLFGFKASLFFLLG
jgi:hypothetical protein